VFVVLAALPSVPLSKSIFLCVFVFHYYEVLLSGIHRQVKDACPALRSRLVEVLVEELKDTAPCEGDGRVVTGRLADLNARLVTPLEGVEEGMALALVAGPINT